MSEFTSCEDCKYHKDYYSGMKSISPCKSCVHSGLSDNFEPKPKKKIIDLSKMVGSDIDMEFWDTLPSIYVGKLEKILDLSPKQYCRKNGINFDNCRVRQDHWHSWQGGECPLPEGLKGEIKNREGSIQSYTFSAIPDKRWLSDGANNNIIAFKVLGVAGGWRYE